MKPGLVGVALCFVVTWCGCAGMASGPMVEREVIEVVVESDSWEATAVYISCNDVERRWRISEVGMAQVRRKRISISGCQWISYSVKVLGSQRLWQSQERITMPLCSRLVIRVGSRVVNTFYSIEAAPCS